MLAEIFSQNFRYIVSVLSKESSFHEDNWRKMRRESITYCGQITFMLPMLIDKQWV